jgi:hypothetical protein
MLADPSGCGRTVGESLVARQGRVEYLLEVCAPCVDADSAYAINGVIVSDFCTPRYYGSSRGTAGACSFTGAIRRPFQLLSNGSLSWLAADGLIYQARADAEAGITVHGGFSAANRDRQVLREFVNALTPDLQQRLSNSEWPSHLLQAEAALRATRGLHAARFRDDIAWRFGFATVGRPSRWETAMPAYQPRETARVAADHAV